MHLLYGFLSIWLSLSMLSFVVGHMVLCAASNHSVTSTSGRLET